LSTSIFEEGVLSDGILYKVEVQFEDLDPFMSLTIRSLLWILRTTLITVFLGPLFYSLQVLYFESNVQGLNGGNGGYLSWDFCSKFAPNA